MTTITENTRLLAAVMFIDIVGYTALMQKDEERAIRLRNRKRRVLEAKVYQHDGEVRQYYGDGALVIFRSAVEAVKAAIQIQDDLAKKPKVSVRIGIHLGDIVTDSEGVYGNAVNVAARIESLSAPGGILISDKVEDELHGHPQIGTTPVGIFELKNVNRPVSLYTVTGRQQAVATREIYKHRDASISEATSLKLIQPYLSTINEGLLN